MIDWAILAALLSFSETNRVSSAVFGIIVLVKHPSSFSLHPPDGSSFLLGMSLYVFSIYPSFNYMKRAIVVCWKTAPHHDGPTSKHIYFWDVMQCLLSFSANFKLASTCFFFSNKVLCSERAYRPLFSLKQLFLLIPTLCVALHKWSLAPGKLI